MIRRSTPVTTVLALTWVGLHVLALVLSGRAAPPGAPWWAWGTPAAGVLVRMGAEVPSLVRAGEVDRLLTHAFLHGAVIHLAFNLWVWIAVGGTLERLVGSARVWLVFVVAVLAGGLAHLFLGAGIAVGASGGVFGAVGALGVWALAHGGPEAKRLRRTVLVFLLLSAVLFLVPNIAHEAHAGGFVGGALALLLLGPRRSSRAPSPALRILAGLLAAVGAAVLVQHVAAAPGDRAAGRHLLDEVRALERLGERLYRNPRRATARERGELGRRIDALQGGPGLEDAGDREALRAYVEAWRPVATGHVPDPLLFEAERERALARWRPVRDRLRLESGGP